MNFMEPIINMIMRKKDEGLFRRYKSKLFCPICGERVMKNFKVRYLVVNGHYGLYTVHFECDKKLNDNIIK